MRLIAQKPCTFGGTNFLIGDEIPVSLVENPKVQERRGVLSIAKGDAPAVSQDSLPQIGEINVPIRAEEGDLILCVSNEELIVFTDILQTPVSKTEDKQKVADMIQNIESEDLLIMLDALDGRSFVKKEAQERAKALSSNGDEQGGDDADENEPEGTPDDEQGGDE